MNKKHSNNIKITPFPIGKDEVRIKICGMKYTENIAEVAALQPDYLGFILYEKSARNFEGTIPKIPDTIKKVGVFVDASLDFMIKKVRKYGFEAVQLHGNESPAYCQHLQRFQDTEGLNFTIWKVFSIKDEFDFSQLQPYEDSVDYFLFDTKGKEKGGNGYTFDWSVLNTYPSSTPFILSGGIGLDELDQIKMILKTTLPIHAIDVNSRLEDTPGLKNIEKVSHFLRNLQIRRDIA